MLLGNSLEVEVKQRKLTTVLIPVSPFGRKAIAKSLEVPDDDDTS
jgi:hypothetical protein